MIIELLAAAIGTVAFSVLYAVPHRHFLACGLIGAAGWLTYRAALAVHVSDAFAVFFATLVIVFLSRIMAVRRQCAATVFLITGIFPLVPGAQIYWAAYYLVTNQFTEASASGFAALKVMIAIVLGIVFVFEAPNRVFLMFGRHRIKRG